MPSPVGHALGGIAAGWIVSPRHDRTAVWTLAALGAAADLDLLIGAHRGPSHSLGASLIVAVIVWASTRSWRWGAAAALAWASHVLLDWLGEDTWAPIGIPALWPFSRAYYQSPLVIFPSVSRQYWRHWELVYFNAKALAVELIVLLPLVAGVVRLASRRVRPSAETSSRT
ncbi:MAG TPA: metal-dependent hydrolase [Vicinamibacterales bacterium]